MGTEPPKNSNMRTWQRSHVSSVMSRVGSTYEYRLNGRVPTNRYTFDTSPVTGFTTAIVGPDQSTSTILPALCPTLLVTCLDSVYAPYRLQNLS